MQEAFARCLISAKDILKILLLAISFSHFKRFLLAELSPSSNLAEIATRF